MCPFSLNNNIQKLTVYYQEYRGGIWRSDVADGLSDKTALQHHYAISHPDIFDCRPLISRCYIVQFVAQPPFHILDICEDRWLNKIKARINIKKMVLPQFKQYLSGSYRFLTPLLHFFFLPCSFCAVILRCRVSLDPCLLFLYRGCTHWLSLQFNSF